MGDAFACGNAVRVGEEILISCGTEPMWGILTSNLPQVQPCDLPSCSINLSQAPAGLLDKWIRCDGKCRRWCHFHCVGINSKPPNLKWFCKRSDCHSPLTATKQQ